MAPPDDAPAGIAGIVVLAFVASLAVALVFAPLMTVGWCNDAAAPDVSRCSTEHRSLLGAASPWWLWMLAQAVVLYVAAGAIRRRVRRD